MLNTVTAALNNYWLMLLGAYKVIRYLVKTLVKISVIVIIRLMCKQFWFYNHIKWLLLYIEFDFLGVRKQEWQLKTKILNIFCILRCWKFQCQIHIKSVEDIGSFWWSSCVTLIGMAAWENFVHWTKNRTFEFNWLFATFHILSSKMKWWNRAIV